MKGSCSSRSKSYFASSTDPAASDRVNLSSALVLPVQLQLIGLVAFLGYCGWEMQS